MPKEQALWYINLKLGSKLVNSASVLRQVLRQLLYFKCDSISVCRTLLSLFVREGGGSLQSEFISHDICKILANGNFCPLFKQFSKLTFYYFCSPSMKMSIIQKFFVWRRKFIISLRSECSRFYWNDIRGLLNWAWQVLLSTYTHQL